MNKLGDHAVVLGAGMSGLLAARVLSDWYDKVIIVERDVLPAAGDNRRGVPQGRHVHVLLASGATILDELFPGILRGMVADGVPAVNDFAQFHAIFGGHRMCGAPKTMVETAYQPSRAYLEGAVRALVRALPNVEIIHESEAIGLVTTPYRDRVTGVDILSVAPGARLETLPADVVVDCTGRTGRTPAWLTDLGYDRPVEDTLDVDIKYASRRYRLRQGALGRHKLVFNATHPRQPRGMGMVAEEHDRWALSLIGYRGHHPPVDPDEFLAFAETVAPPEALAAIRDAEPLGDVAVHRHPTSLRRRYERLRRFPKGLLVFGDAICSFNPVYGQGMSVAAMQAVALRDCLAQGDKDLARRFFRAAAKVVDVAWRLAVGGDRAMPQVHGSLSVPAVVMNRYVERLLSAAEADQVVLEQFLRVSGLVDPPVRLMRPSIMLRVLSGDRRRRLEHQAKLSEEN